MVLLSLCLIVQTSLFAQTKNRLNGAESGYIQFTVSPFSQIAQPVGKYNKLGSTRAPSGISAEVKCSSRWNVGIGIKTDFSFIPTDSKKVSKTFKERGFSEKSNNVVYNSNNMIDAPENIELNGFIFYSFNVRKRINFDFELGCIIMELDNLLYPDQKELAYLGYTDAIEPYTYYHLEYKYSHVPVIAWSIGCSVDYIFGKLIGLSLNCDYIWAYNDMRVIASSTQKRSGEWNDAIIKDFSYKQFYSVLNIGLSLIIRIDNK